MKTYISVQPKYLAREMGNRIKELEREFPNQVATILAFHRLPDSKMIVFDLDIYTLKKPVYEFNLSCLFFPDELDYVATEYSEQLHKSCPDVPLLKDDKNWHNYVDTFREKKKTDEQV